MRLPSAFSFNLLKFRMSKLPGGNIWGMKDLKKQAFDLVPYLRSSEKIIFVQKMGSPDSAELPDYRLELSRLSGVKRPADIGANGPAKASLSLKGRENDIGQGLYSCRFGRDGLFAAGDLMDFYPALAKTTLLDYASLIGMSENRQREEEFGKMFHEYRDADDVLAVKISEDDGWGWPFYGSADATPLFVNLLLRYCLKHGPRILDETYVGRDGREYKMRDALSFSLRWIIGRLNRNKEFFLEYKPGFKGSIANQAMEDSYDSHFYSDGRLPDTAQGVASAEIQGQAYDSLALGAYCYDKFEIGHKSESNYFRFLAGELKKSILEYLWVEDEKGAYFAAGTGRDEKGRVKTMKIRKAIPFFLLNTMLLSGENKEEAEIIRKSVETIFSSELLAAGGIRSLAYDEQRFMPGAYHNGSVWLFQTFQIAEGLRKHGYADLAEDLDKRILRSVETLKFYPEYVRGDKEDVIRINERIVDTYDKEDGFVNRREQAPQQVQLWTLTAYAAIKNRQKEVAKTGANVPVMKEELAN